MQVGLQDAEHERASHPDMPATLHVLICQAGTQDQAQESQGANQTVQDGGTHVSPGSGSESIGTSSTASAPGTAHIDFGSGGAGAGATAAGTAHADPGSGGGGATSAGASASGAGAVHGAAHAGARTAAAAQRAPEQVAGPTGRSLGITAFTSAPAKLWVEENSDVVHTHQGATPGDASAGGADGMAESVQAVHFAETTGGGFSKGRGLCATADCPDAAAGGMVMSAQAAHLCARLTHAEVLAMLDACKALRGQAEALNPNPNLQRRVDTLNQNPNSQLESKPVL